MSENLLNDFLGLDFLELRKIADETDERRKEIAVAITKLSEYPEWIYFENELKRMLENINKPSEFYAEKPNMAWYDSGLKRSVQIIQNFIKTQRQLVEKYAKEKEK